MRCLNTLLNKIINHHSRSIQNKFILSSSVQFKYLLTVFFVLIPLVMHSKEVTKTKIESEKDGRGLLPELQSTDSQDDKKALGSELLITRAENKAIDALNNILKKKKGSPEEPDLWYRLAELYMRRSKSGRFFEQYQNGASANSKTMSSFPIPKEKGSENIRKAVDVYNKIEKDFPKYREMDSVLFNNAFAHQQLRLFNVSESLYKKMIERFDQSPLYTDALLALAELLYDQTRFADALPFFKKIEGFPESRVYSYGLYKMAWTYYNLKKSDEGIEKLLQVVKIHPAGQIQDSRGYNLRKEALRDLTIFIGDSKKPEELYPFFVKITTEDELGQAILDLAKLYDSHSRFKEIPIFVKEFNDHHKENAFVIKTHMVLINSYETLKQRDLVLQNLQSAADLCKKDSAWSKKQSPEFIQESCHKTFREESLEISKKWWEIWLKNKTHKEFSSYTERALRFVLQNDDPENPDYKTRYALAELLFQKESFLDSSKEYQIVSLTKGLPQDIHHDSSYAALFALDNYLKTAKIDKKTADLRKTLTLYYLEYFPKGDHFNEVKMKYAVLLYEEQHFKESLNQLGTLLQSKIEPKLKTKAEDLVLDIYNIQKNYPELKKNALQYSKNASDLPRKDYLDKIAEQAHYSEAQSIAAGEDKMKGALALKEFIDQNPKSSLLLEATWQSIGLMHLSENYLEAAEMALSFAQKYPQDKRAIESIQEAAQIYSQYGELERAAQLFLELGKKKPAESKKFTLIAAQYYWLENNKLKSRLLYSELLKSSTQEEEKKEYRTLLLGSFDETEKKSDNYQKLIQSYVDQGLEPFHTDWQIQQLSSYFKDSRFKETFELAKKVMNKSFLNESQKSPARYYQAKILEQEFLSQSLKTSKEERMALVISLKTDKMEKALSSYLSVLKMNPPTELQIEVLAGIDRIYLNFIQSFGDFRAPASLPEADQSALNNEIKSSIEAIKSKKEDNLKELDTLQKKYSSVVRPNSWTALPVDQTPSPDFTLPSRLKWPMEFSYAWNDKKEFWNETKNIPKCLPLDPFLKTSYPEQITIMNSCRFDSKSSTFKDLYKWSLSKESHRPWGYYFMSIESEKAGKYSKAKWALDQALHSIKKVKIKQPNEIWEPILQLQLRSQYLLGETENLDKMLKSFSDMKLSSTNSYYLSALSFFKSSHFENAIEKFSLLSEEDIYNREGGLIWSEALFQTKKKNQALKVLMKLEEVLKKDTISVKEKNEKLIKIKLQMARVYESDEKQKNEALIQYNSIKQMGTQPELDQWIDKKVKYLTEKGKTSS